jgi:hypothetical protein
MKTTQHQIERIKIILLIIVLVINGSGIYAREQASVSGILIDQKSKQAIAYANVVLYNSSDSSLFTGTISDTEGKFTISPVSDGSYRLSITMIGYQSVSKQIEIVNKSNYDAGILFLQENVINLNEMVVIGERLKAKAELDKTTFFMTKKMVDASNTGTDILRLIPGVQVDFMQNISLEGSQNIMILVDGKERDRNFVSQINPRQIEKVEVINAPSSKYDANVTGALNIILKKEHDSGINGQIYAEIPGSSSEIYISPTYSLNYGFKKINLYTSYNGAISNFNLNESTNRKLIVSSGINEIKSVQYVRQKDWSHRFHYGFDYFINSENQVNFYAFYNPFSREYSGTAELHLTGVTNRQWQAQKEDADINNSTFYSLYFKHIFKDKGGEIAIDLSNYHLKAKNTVTYTSEELDNSSKTLTNRTRPGQNAASIKIDYNTSQGKKLSFSTGLKAKFQLLQDLNSRDFNYSENIFAAFTSFGYKQTKFDLNMGLRIENSLSNSKNNFSNNALTLLPFAALNLKVSSNQNIKISMSRSINRPKIYQLNPSITFDDPYSMRKGNPDLKPELRSTVFIEHSIRFKSNNISTRLYYNKLNNAINNLTFSNDTDILETRIYNLGTIDQYGVQFTAALSLGKIISISPYIRLFDLVVAGNDLAQEYTIEKRHQTAFESGFSTILSFKRDFALSLIFQYASPKYNIQGSSFSDALYFLSFEKTFNKKFKAGIVSAIPLTKSFTYQGTEITGSDFSSHYEGDIKMSRIPVWFKISYQFNSGKKHERINRNKEEIDSLPKKGL